MVCVKAYTLLVEFPVAWLFLFPPLSYRVVEQTGSATGTRTFRRRLYRATGTSGRADERMNVRWTAFAEVEKGKRRRTTMRTSTVSEHVRSEGGRCAVQPESSTRDVIRDTVNLQREAKYAVHSLPPPVTGISTSTSTSTSTGTSISTSTSSSSSSSITTTTTTTTTTIVIATSSTYADNTVAPLPCKPTSSVVDICRLLCVGTHTGIMCTS